MFGITKRSFFRELKRSCRGCNPRLSLGLHMFDDGYVLDLFGMFIPLLFLDRWLHNPEEIMESWGLRHFERAIHFNWGSRCNVVRLPWHYKQLKHEVMRADGSWTPYVGIWETGKPIKNTAGVTVFEGGKEPDRRQEWTFPYRYTLKNGDVQERTATVHIERREWRWRSLMWCPWPAIRRQSIDVQFSGEVGERTGSWKGGCVGCGYEMLPNETAEQTLRRMERERIFN